jgi:hypothetical protein
MFDMLKQAGPVALISLFMGLVPLGLGILYALRPSEQRLALMRPLSLATIFAAVHGTAAGFLHVFRNIGISDQPAFDQRAFIGMAESLVPMFFDFGCLMLAWICVAVGLGRKA